MNTCNTCVFWIDDDPGPYSCDSIMHPADEDTFEEKVMPFEVKKCRHPGITKFERNPDPAGVSLTDASRYNVTIYTGPDFGCVNHSTIDTSKNPL